MDLRFDLRGFGGSQRRVASSCCRFSSSKEPRDGFAEAIQTIAFVRLRSRDRLGARGRDQQGENEQRGQGYESQDFRWADMASLGKPSIIIRQAAPLAAVIVRIDC